MHSVLWPYLLEFINKSEYLNSANVIFKNLNYIAEAKKKDEQYAEDYLIDYSKFPNVPKNYDIMSILIILIGRPANRGINIMKFMSNFPLNINQAFVHLWENAIPKLSAKLEGKKMAKQSKNRSKN
jgi:hypothetical protein